MKIQAAAMIFSRNERLSMQTRLRTWSAVARTRRKQRRVIVGLQKRWLRVGFHSWRRNAVSFLAGIYSKQLEDQLAQRDRVAAQRLVRTLKHLQVRCALLR